MGILIPNQVVVALAQQLAGGGVYEECSVGVRAHEVLIVAAGGNDVIHHAEDQSRVGAGANGNPPVCLRRSAREARVHYDEFRAGLLRVEEEMGFLHVGFGVVAAEHDNGLSSNEIFPAAAILLHAERRKEAHVACVVTHDAKVSEGGAVVGHGKQ